MQLDLLMICDVESTMSTMPNHTLSYATLKWRENFFKPPLIAECVIVTAHNVNMMDRQYQLTFSGKPAGYFLVEHSLFYRCDINHACAITLKLTQSKVSIVMHSSSTIRLMMIRHCASYGSKFIYPVYSLCK